MNKDGDGAFTNCEGPEEGQPWILTETVMDEQGMRLAVKNEGTAIVLLLTHTHNVFCEVKDGEGCVDEDVQSR